MKDALETKIGARLTPNSTIIPWIVAHAARTMNRYQVGTDGKTAYRRWKGKDFKREVAEIGESILYLKAGTQGKHKFVPRWEKGVWLGVRDESSDIIVGTDLGTVKARDFKRLADPLERWNKEAIMQMKGTPWEPIPGTRDDSIPVHVRLPEEEGNLQPREPGNLSEPQREIRRRARITRDEVLKAGFTAGCPGCRTISRNAPSQVCRQRIEK